MGFRALGTGAQIPLRIHTNIKNSCVHVVSRTYSYSFAIVSRFYVHIGLLTCGVGTGVDKACSGFQEQHAS